MNITPQFDDSLVSIITPAFNSARFIGETIRSVQAQTYPHWELLITDDKSPDNLKEIVLEFCKADERVKYFEALTNGGPAKARNNSLEFARGRYLAFLDSDDLWSSTKLEEQLQFMSQNHAGFSFTFYERISVEGTPSGFTNTSPLVVNYDMLLKNTSIATLTVMLDRAVVGNVRLKPGWGYDDFVLWLDLLRKGHLAHCLPKSLAKYRVMEKSVSSNKIRAAKWVWRIYREQEKLSILKSFWCLLNFSTNATRKRLGL